MEEAARSLKRLIEDAEEMVVKCKKIADDFVGMQEGAAAER